MTRSVLPAPAHLALAPVLLAMALLAGCQRTEEARPEPVRPVISMIVQERADAAQGFAGVIQPRVKSDLGFRVLGRVTSRDVKVGDRVTRDQHLATVDATALDLAVQAARANLASANAQLANVSGAEERQRALYESRTATQATLDAAVQARDSARASAQRAKAALDKAQEQLGYAVLIADYDGVVTATPVDVGQVVAPGQTVVTIARPDDREAVVNVPDWLESVRPNTAFTVSLELDPSVSVRGRVREMAPEADSITRTRIVRIALNDAPPAFRLGTTILARPDIKVTPRLEIPRSAILEEGGKAFVFVVENAKVLRREVAIADAGPETVAVVRGLDPGMRIVTAGVHSLKDGQTIKPPGGAE